MGIIRTHPPDLSMARSKPARVCRCGSDVLSRLVGGVARHIHSDHSVRPAIPLAAGRGDRHHVVSLSLHLAVERGSRGRDRDGPARSRPAPRRHSGRTPAVALGYHEWNALFQHHHVLHHPVDCLDPSQGWHTDVSTAAEAAEALKPFAGDAAGVLFAIGVIAVGFLAVPIMTTGAAYDFCQVMGWKSSLNAKPKDAKKFYAAIAGFTAIAIGMNFLGFNPMKAL